jgi:hypothetical protein
MVLSAKDLSPEQQQAVEALLGRTIREDEEISVVAAGPPTADRRSRRHISDVIAENMRDMPPEVLAELPTDGASEHDHYIYGLPKRYS